MTQDNQINSPEHYNQGNIECIDALESMCSPEEFMGFLRCNVLKYLWRVNHKDNTKQDIMKADWYLRRFINFQSAYSQVNEPYKAELRQLVEDIDSALNKNAESDSLRIVRILNDCQIALERILDAS